MLLSSYKIEPTRHKEHVVYLGAATKIVAQSVKGEFTS